MIGPLGIVVAGAAVPALLAGRWMRRRARRQRNMSRPLPPEWEAIVRRNVALYAFLPPELHQQHAGHTRNLLVEKHFEGCGGLALTEEMRVTIAAQAALLILNRSTNYFPKCDSILVYPSAYVAPQKRRVGFVEVEEDSARLGESWMRGVVVLAWDNVLAQGRRVGTGHNVVLHEFAHQLDQEDGAGDGTPILGSRKAYAVWARVLTHEYEDLVSHVQHHVRDVMDAYGATNAAEFFAVATETFFDNAHEMRRRHPSLYEVLKDYYRVDPAAWRGTATEEA